MPYYDSPKKELLLSKSCAAYKSIEMISILLSLHIGSSVQTLVVKYKEI